MSDTANLAGVRQAIEHLCATSGFEAQACDQIGLCVNEALANVIRHAYNGAPNCPIEITAEVAQEAARIAIRDWGCGVNPERQPVAPHDPLKPGGLGLILLRQMMDEVAFTPQSCGMLLEMTRKKVR